MKRLIVSNKTRHGFAMITVLLLILIFFIIAITMSTIITLHARNANLTALSEISFFMADSGIRLATARAMHLFFMYSPSYSSIQNSSIEKTIELEEYKAKIAIEVYTPETLPASFSGGGYTHMSRVFSNAEIYRPDNMNMPVAQRHICAEIYLGHTEGTSTSPGGEVKAITKGYYEKNR